MSITVLFSSLSGRYAKALFESGKKDGILDVLLDNFVTFIDFYSKNKQLFSKYGNTAKCTCEKLADVMNLNQRFASLLKVLTENHRLELIDKIYSVFRKAVMDHNDEQEVSVYMATELNEELKDEIHNGLNKIYNKKLKIKYMLDKKLLSGIIIKTNGVMIDASGSLMIKQLEKYCKSLELI